MIPVVRQFFKNLSTSSAGMLIGLAISFFFTPYLISKLGKDMYGIWTLAFSLIAYMSLADIGMQQSLVRYVSMHYASKNWNQLNRVISSSARLYFAIALLVLIAALLISCCLMQLLQIPPLFLETAQITLVILGLKQALYFATLPYCALGPFHRFDIVNYFQIGSRIIETVCIIILLEAGYGLVEMALVILILNGTTAVWRYRIRHTLYPEVRFERKAINSETTRQLLSYGSYSFLIVLAWTVIFQTDNIVIAGFVSTEAVAIYSVPAMMITQLRSAITTISVPLVPTISHFDALNDRSKIMTIYEKSTRYMYYLSGFACIAILFFGGPFILLWVKKEFVEAIVILHILILAAAFTFPQMITNSILLGISKHKATFLVLISEATANIILSVILVGSMGIIGVALGTAIPQLIIYIFIYPIVFYRIMESNIKPFYLTAARSLIYSIVFTLPPAYFMIKLLTPDTWMKLIIGCVGVTIVMLSGLCAFVMDPKDRRLIADKIRGLLP